MAISKRDRSHNSGRFKNRGKHTNPSQNQLTDADWQFLGKLELRVAADAEQKVHVWLIEALKPLDLQEDFVHKVLRSAQGAVARLVHAESIEFEHIHITLFVPPQLTRKDRSWGFFRIEKSMVTAEDHVVHGRMIALYLYLEEQ